MPRLVYHHRSDQSTQQINNCIINIHPDGWVCVPSRTTSPTMLVRTTAPPSRNASDVTRPPPASQDDVGAAPPASPAASPPRPPRRRRRGGPPPGGAAHQHPHHHVGGPPPEVTNITAITSTAHVHAIDFAAAPARRRQHATTRSSSPSNDCAGGNGLYAGLNGALPPRRQHRETLTWHYQVPAPLKIASYRLWRAARLGPRRTTRRRSIGWRASEQYTGAYVRRARELPGTGAPGSATRRPLRRRQPRHRGQTGRRARPLPQRRLRRRGRLQLHRAEDSPTRRGLLRMYRAAIVLQDDADPVFTSPPAAR